MSKCVLNALWGYILALMLLKHITQMTKSGKKLISLENCSDPPNWSEKSLKTNINNDDPM